MVDLIVACAADYGFGNVLMSWPAIPCITSVESLLIEDAGTLRGSNTGTYTSTNYASTVLGGIEIEGATF